MYEVTIRENAQDTFGQKKCMQKIKQGICCSITIEYAGNEVVA